MAVSEGPEVLDLTNSDTKRVCSHFRQQRNSKELCYYITQRVDSNRSFLKIFCRDPVIRKAFAREINEFLRKETVLEAENTTSNDPGHLVADEHSGSQNGRLDESNEFKSMNGTAIVSEESQNVAESEIEDLEEFAQETSATRENGGPGAVSNLSVPPIDSIAERGNQDEKTLFDAFTCPIVRVKIERPPKELREFLLLRPYAAMLMNKSNVNRGTALQNAAWPDLFERKSMALIGPRSCGKTFAYLPVALTLSLKDTAVVLTATDARISKLDSMLSYLQLPIDVTRPPSKIYNAKKQLLICSLHWFCSNRRNLTPSVVIFDKLDRMLERALDVTCVEVAQSCSHIPLIATARKLTPQLEQTLELMNISSSVMVPCQSRIREFREYLVSIDDTPESSRYQTLLSVLRKESPDEVILIFFLDETEVNSMYDKLDEEANKSTVPFSNFHNLCEKFEEERNLLRSYLNDGSPGVYLACLQDHNWLFTTSSVHTIINYRPPDCAQAYRYRRQRLRDNGKVLTITRSLDLNAFPEDLFYILSNLTGYDDVNPHIDKLRQAFEDEKQLRNTLRFHLLS